MKIDCIEISFRYSRERGRVIEVARGEAREAQLQQAREFLLATLRAHGEALYFAADEVSTKWANEIVNGTWNNFLNES